MNLDLDETQQELAALATGLFERRCTPERLETVAGSADGVDRELWAALADAGLVGITVPAAHGGLGFGAVEAAVVLEAAGRAVAPVPFTDAAVTGQVLAPYADRPGIGAALDALAAGRLLPAVAPVAAVVADGGALLVIGVPWAHVADLLLVPHGADVLVVEHASGGGGDEVQTTAGVPGQTVRLDPAAATALPGAAAALVSRHRAALAAFVAGVTSGAVRLAAGYTSTREQFGKPLSTFQAVALKAADAYLDASAIRDTALQAAWAIEHTADPALAVLTAAWWAAEAGQHCVHVTQHLHGGMGADVTYPAHRFFLWGKQIELMLGGASALLAELGDALAARADAGDAVRL